MQFIRLDCYMGSEPDRVDAKTGRTIVGSELRLRNALFWNNV